MKMVIGMMPAPERPLMKNRSHVARGALYLVAPVPQGNDLNQTVYVIKDIITYSGGGEEPPGSGRFRALA
jgi:hypothetical protein